MGEFLRKENGWEGGYFIKTKGGRLSFIIEREVGKIRYHRSTGQSTRRGAIEQLAIFEKNPAAYRAPAHDTRAVTSVKMTVELVEEFTTWHEVEKGNTSRHAYYTAKYLYDWLEDLKGIDLRNVTLNQHVDPALAKRKCRAHRIAALKVFYAWLRTNPKKRLLTSSEDCTLDLPVPQAVPAKRRKKKAVEHEVVRRVMDALPQRYRDVLLFMASAGWHITEVQRFARDPRSELVELTPEAIARHHCIAVAKTWHKGKVWTVTPILTQQHLDAAKRIRAAETFPRKFNEQLRAASDSLGGEKAGVPYFPLGVMRHSFSTWHVERGADAKRVSLALNHKSERTTTDFYIDVNVPNADLPAIDFPGKPADLMH